MMEKPARGRLQSPLGSIGERKSKRRVCFASRFGDFPSTAELRLSWFTLPRSVQSPGLLFCLWQPRPSNGRVLMDSVGAGLMTPG